MWPAAARSRALLSSSLNALGARVKAMHEQRQRTMQCTVCDTVYSVRHDSIRAVGCPPKYFAYVTLVHSSC